ncbi:hypothetical protein TIFTF001_029169 [Ficus carica]|uniref:Uncharacterized protein n=1 Tax=Ficus carica TaxID=3494 RepID=A0AA88DV99_FICCA|nr:hypothetical protein TIFTF001_029169 [Ficus carica]
MASKSPVLYRPALGRVGLWFELEMDWPSQPLHSHAPVKKWYVMYDKLSWNVNNLSAMLDTRWKGVAGHTVKCGRSSRYAFCSLRIYVISTPSPVYGVLATIADSLLDDASLVVTTEI